MTHFLKLTHDVRFQTWGFQCGCGASQTCNTEEAAGVAADAHRRLVGATEPERQKLTRAQRSSIMAARGEMRRGPRTKAEYAAQVGMYESRKTIRI